MAELLVKLGIDWRLLIAQLVNFLVLFVILRKFLFRPAVAMLEKRQRRIAEGVAHAEEADAHLARADAARKDILQTAERERGAMLERTAAESTALRVQRIEEADRDAEAIRVRAAQAAEEQRIQALADARQELGALVLAAAQQVTAGALTNVAHEKLIADALRDVQPSS